MSPVRWLTVLAAAALVVSLLIWARGDDHHRGDEVGAISQAVQVVQAVR